MTRIDPEQVKASVSLADVAARFITLTKAGNEYRAICPFHDDTKPSLTIYEKRGEWRYKCFACNEGGDIFAFYAAINGLDLKADFRRIVEEVGNGVSSGTGKIVTPPLKKAPPREIVPVPHGVPAPELGAGGELGGSVHPYLDANGDLIAFAVYKEGEREPAYWTYGRYATQDPPRWERRGWRENAPLYGLEQIARRDDAQVLICGSERSADAAGALFPSMVAVAYPGGMGGYRITDFSPLDGRNVVLWPDNDAPGRQAMERVAALLQGVAAEVKGIDPDTQEDGSATPEAWDAADALASGWDSERTLAWAKARITVYVAPQQEPDAPESPTTAPETAPAVDTSAPAEPVVAHPDAPEGHSEASAPMPEAEFPPEASPIRPKRPRKPALASVDGNTVRVLEIEPEPEMLPAYAEAVLADRFAAGPGKEYRYTAGWNCWHKWDGFRWIMDGTKKITWDAFLLVREVARESRDATPAQRARVTTLKTTNAVIGLVSSYPDIAIKADVWDRDPMLVGTPDGVIDLKTGKLTTSERDQYITRSVAVSPVRAECPHWDGVINRATKGDATMRDYLQRWCGYILTGDTREECFLFVYGPGGSGKSTFIRVLSAIMGDYARSAKMDAFQAKDRQEHSEEIARLAGARLVSATETDEGARWNESRIKTLTGRDKIAARHMHKDTFEFMPQFKLVFAGNHKPSLRSVGEEMRRRIHLVAFDETIPEEQRDRKLGEKLEAEYPAILQWMIDGCLAWQDYGLGRPEVVATAVENYLRDEDTFGSWIDDCLEIQKGEFTQSSDAYANYERWCDKNGEHFKLSQKRFSQKLEDRGYPRGKHAGSRGFFGFSLRLGANL